ncbi:MAG TPA: S8 family serine peptidase [Lacipirellula sp.]
MARQGTRKAEFSARIEQLEDRRVMSADPLGGLLGGVDHQVLEQQTPLVDQHELGDPDFWINPADADLVDSYFQEVEQALTEAHNQTGWFNVKNNYGFTGRGQTVAVIDSGIAYNHFALGGGLGANYRVVGGWDFTEENDANPYDDGSRGGHGTHVSGIIGSSSGTHTGVAPGVDFVGLRVFNDAGAGYFSWVEKALKWVYDNRDAFENPITTVNLSLGVSSWNAASVPQWANLEDEFARLESAGIFIAVSAGNSFGSFGAPGLSYPASSQYVVPVMSTDDSGALSSFSQRLGRAIAAPGRSIVSTIPDYKGNNNGVADDFASMSGTSMAAPYIAGASVIIREAMEFVGMTNITQDMIYDHMMATADSIYDAVTKLSYKRLDLQAAIDALMPADDYGSTLADAYNLGSLSGTSSVSGGIGSLTDVDCFRFTAAASGNVTFDLSTSTGGMAGSWQVYGANGQAITSASDDSVTFAVTAGQTYTVRLGSTGGMGQYTFDVTAASAFNPEDWGAVAFNQLANIGVSGEAWYRVQTTRDGLFTALAQFNAAGGQVNVELYNSNMQLVASGITANGQARVDAAATAGTEFYIRVTGSNSDVDFTLANLVSQVGSTVTVDGTAGDDAFTFTAGSAYEVSVNGVSYTFARNAATQFVINGGTGDDSITMTGSTAAETATLRIGNASLTSAAYTAVATDVESVRVHGGGGVDTAVLHDSAGDDHLIAGQDSTTMTGAGLDYFVQGFAHVEAYATQGMDKSELYDSEGNDRFQGKSTGSSLTGSGYSRLVAGFDNVYAYSLAGGNDLAELWDTAAADIFTARPTYATMRSGAALQSVHNFENVFAYAVAGGRDFAFLYDSPLDDVFVSRPHYSYVRGSNFYNFASGFDSIRTHSTAGGNDVSLLFGSTGNETAIVERDHTRLYGAGFDLSAHGFASTRLVGMGGRDTVRMEALDVQDAVFGRGNAATLTRGGQMTRIDDFDRVIAAQLAGRSPSIDVQAIDYLFERLLG